MSALVKVRKRTTWLSRIVRQSSVNLNMPKVSFMAIHKHNSNVKSFLRGGPKEMMSFHGKASDNEGQQGCGHQVYS
jgi:hypothetical protein